MLSAVGRSLKFTQEKFSKTKKTKKWGQKGTKRIEKDIVDFSCFLLSINKGKKIASFNRGQDFWMSAGFHFSYEHCSVQTEVQRTLNSCLDQKVRRLYSFLLKVKAKNKRDLDIKL